MVFFYKVYIGYIGGTLSGNSSIGYRIRYCISILQDICTGYSERYPIRISIGYTGNSFLEILEDDSIPPYVNNLIRWNNWNNQYRCSSFFWYCLRKRRKVCKSFKFKYIVFLMCMISFLFYTKWNTL